MNNKQASILFKDLDKESRHYIMRRVMNPTKKFPGPKPKKDESNQ